MSCEQEDTAMNKACNEKYKGSRAVTYSEIMDGRINGLQKNDTRFSDLYCVAHSGGSDLWKGKVYRNGNRRFFRNGWNVWPYGSEFNCKALVAGQRCTIAVTDASGCSIVLKEIAPVSQ